MKRGILFFIGIIFSIIVNGCSSGGGGGGSSSSSETFTGSVVESYISGATVTFYSLNSNGSRGSSIGSSTTDSSGVFSVSIVPSVPSTPFLAETSGGTYTDEATGLTVNLTSSDHLCAVLPGDTTHAAITALTHIACERALVSAANGVALADAVDAANAGVAQQFNLTSIIDVLPVDATNATDNQTANLDQRLYGLVLAAISQEANGLGVSAFDLTLALAEDATDGTLDGQADGVNIVIPNSMLNLDPADGLTNLQASLDTFVGSVNNNTNLTSAQVGTTATNIGINTAGSLYTTSAVLPAWTYDVAGTAQIDVSGGTAPYSCLLFSGSVPTGLSLGPDCSVSGTIAGPGSMTIFAPFTVTVTDSAMNSINVNLFVTVVEAPPTISAITSGSCYAGMACTVQVATATGGSAPLYYVKANLSVTPTGMAIDLDGNLTGTAPSTAGTYPFGICVVDSIGAQDCTTTSIEVVSGVSIFNGSYSGGYSGTATVQGQQYPVNGSVMVTVTDRLYCDIYRYRDG